MDLSTALGFVQRTARNHGTGPAAHDFAIRSVNKCLYYQIMQCLVIDAVDHRCLTLPPNLRFAKLTQNELLSFSKLPENELTTKFLSEAFAKNDECYAILEGDTLASYGWYSRNPTVTNSEDLVLHFDPQYVYMYKGFTLKRYRGQRLHAIGMTRALEHYLSRGLNGLVSYVESNNFDSLKSCYRMGYRNCGRIRVMRLAGKYRVSAQPDCAPYGLTIRQKR